MNPTWEHVMHERFESNVSALLVAPQLLAQLELLDVMREAHARVDLTCVSTCGGALRALDAGEVDCLLLSTDLIQAEEERRELTALLREARNLGIPVLSIGDATTNEMGVRVHESLTRDDVALGRLDEAIERAQALASVERTLMPPSH